MGVGVGVLVGVGDMVGVGVHYYPGEVSYVSENRVIIAGQVYRVGRLESGSDSSGGGLRLPGQRVFGAASVAGP